MSVPHPSPRERDEERERERERERGGGRQEDPPVVWRVGEGSENCIYNGNIAKRYFNKSATDNDTLTLGWGCSVGLAAR